MPAWSRPAIAPLARELGEPKVAGEAQWRAPAVADTLTELPKAGPAGRQRARWDHARALIGEGRSADALGVLEVMRSDEPDLRLSAAFQLALGRVLVDLRRGPEAFRELDRPSLAANAEACAWRLRALKLAGAHGLAVGQMSCAKPALAARSRMARSPFLAAAARSAERAGLSDLALHWLDFASDREPEVLLARARALLSKRDGNGARDLYRRLEPATNGEANAEARLGLIEAEALLRPAARREALEALRGFGFGWRGGPVEERALWRSFDLARSAGDPRASLRSAATLVRYHSPGPRLAPLLAESQAILAGLLGSDGKLPLGEAAGIYWDYRDLAPSGSAGDLLAYRLADRLQEAGLYDRAAGLLEHQLTARARDIAQGPLSVRVARLHILAGRPAKAIQALRASADNIYPALMLNDRLKIEAVALQLTGRGSEALALLQGVPGSGALQAELLWKQKSWEALADLMDRIPESRGPMGEVREALVLRQAITLGMLGREDRLELLRRRFQGRFGSEQTARAFDLLTRPAGALNADELSAAMAAIPSVSPAGDLADLLDARPVRGSRTG